jgi:phosphotransferase system enzyme I (PtsI)
VSPGAVAAPMLLIGERAELPEESGSVADVDAAMREVGGAIASVADQLEAQASATGAEAAAVLRAQALIVADPVLREAIQQRLTEGASRSGAVAEAFAIFRQQLEAAGPYFADRVEDLDDLSYRVRATILGVPLQSWADAPRGPRVVVADELAPSDLLALGPSVVGLVTERGGATGHTAIVAKSLGIPTVVGCPGVTDLPDGTLILLDGRTGRIAVDPDADTVQRALADEAARTSRAAALAGPGRTADGAPVALLANLGSDHGLLAETDCEGVGLFRTEFLFLDRTEAPSFDEQVEAYAALLRGAAGRRVVIRTLDAGSDKPLAFVPSGTEPNPALGVRGYRIVTRHEGLVDEQLRAIATAASVTGATPAVMAPMVSTVAEVRSFVARARGHGLSEVGVMAEVPALVLAADRVLAECDFLSIGTNDLAQYAFAADRQLEEFADLLDPWQPALLRLLSLAVDAAVRAGKPVSVCGEAASDPELAVVLAGLGISSLSMAPVSIPAVRAALADRTLEECRNAARVALEQEDPGTARDAVRSLRQTASTA